MSRVHFLAHHGSSLVSKLIRWQTRSEWNHISVQIDDLVYEAMEGAGVRVRGLQQIAHDVIGKRERVLALRPTLDLTDAQREEMQSFLHSQIGKPYDYTMVARFVSRVNRESNDSQAKWFCSELAYASARRVGLRLFRDTAAWEVPPGLFVRSPFLEEESNDWWEAVVS
jgi:hypothetical protein